MQTDRAMEKCVAIGGIACARAILAEKSPGENTHTAGYTILSTLLTTLINLPDKGYYQYHRPNPWVRKWQIHETM